MTSEAGMTPILDRIWNERIEAAMRGEVVHVVMSPDVVRDLRLEMDGAFGLLLQIDPATSRHRVFGIEIVEDCEIDEVKFEIGVAP